MKDFLKKLFLGRNYENETPLEGTIQKRWRNVKSIWNNEHHDDVGVEKIFRLLLALSQFASPGTYIKQVFGKKGIAMQEFAMDIFVLLKVFFPIVILMNGWQNNTMIFYIMMWFMADTFLYVPTLIFASDIFSKPRSYRRSMLLVFLNYIETVLSFGVIYDSAPYFNKPFEHWFDPIYFSFVTSATVGYGDYYPVTEMGKFWVSAQTVVVIMFVVLFLNFFSNKLENKGYFDHTNKS
jgi:hypothetical protein